MLNSHRSSLDNYGFATLKDAAEHPGLWYDRFLEQQPQKERKESLEPYGKLVAQSGQIREPSVYKHAYKRWKETLRSMGVQPIVAKTTYRLAAGHGRESVIETGIALHHTYGVPTIPGSSLKGAAASYAASNLANWDAKSPAHKALFGTTDGAGVVTFFDALPLPGTWKLLPDIITVHHQEYYQGSKPPGDWDDPIPIPFLSAVGHFLIAVAVPDHGADGWANAAYGILQLALAEEGVGGKTSSSYGRLDME